MSTLTGNLPFLPRPLPHPPAPPPSALAAPDFPGHFEPGCMKSTSLSFGMIFLPLEEKLSTIWTLPWSLVRRITPFGVAGIPPLLSPPTVVFLLLPFLPASRRLPFFNGSTSGLSCSGDVVFSGGV